MNDLIAMQLILRENVSLNSKSLDDVVNVKPKDVSTLIVAICR